MRRSFAEIKMNLLFHSLVFTSHLKQVLHTPLQKCLNNESRGWQPEHGGRRLHAHQRPRAARHAAGPCAGSSSRPLPSRCVPPHGSRSGTGVPGEVLALLPAAMLLLRPCATSPTRAAARVPSPADVGTTGLSSSPPRAAAPGETVRPGEGHELGPGDGTFFFILN